MKKKWYKSKTVWLNVITAIGVFTLNQFGYEITEYQTTLLLSLINLLLRSITKEGLTS
jgi:hypothetical protein